MESCTMSSVVQVCSSKEPRSIGNFPSPNSIRGGHHSQLVFTQWTRDFFLWFSLTPGPFVVPATNLGASFTPQFLSSTWNSLVVHQAVILTIILHCLGRYLIPSSRFLLFNFADSTSRKASLGYPVCRFWKWIPQQVRSSGIPSIMDRTRDPISLRYSWASAREGQVSGPEASSLGPRGWVSLGRIPRKPQWFLCSIYGVASVPARKTKTQ